MCEYFNETTAANNHLEKLYEILIPLPQDLPWAETPCRKSFGQRLLLKTFLGVLTTVPDQHCLSLSTSTLNIYSLYLCLSFSMNKNLFNHFNLKQNIFKDARKRWTSEKKNSSITLQVLNFSFPFFFPTWVVIFWGLFFYFGWVRMDSQGLHLQTRSVQAWLIIYKIISCGNNN